MTVRRPCPGPRWWWCGSCGDWRPKGEFTMGQKRLGEFKRRCARCSSVARKRAYAKKVRGKEELVATDLRERLALATGRRGFVLAGITGRVVAALAEGGLVCPFCEDPLVEANVTTDRAGESLACVVCRRGYGADVEGYREWLERVRQRCYNRVLV